MLIVLHYRLFMLFLSKNTTIRLNFDKVLLVPFSGHGVVDLFAVVCMCVECSLQLAKRLGRSEPNLTYEFSLTQNYFRQVKVNVKVRAL